MVLLVKVKLALRSVNVLTKLPAGGSSRKKQNCYYCIRHPDIRVKHCTYGHSVATLLKPRGVTTVSLKYSLSVARHATVVVIVPSTSQYPANYTINNLI
jgi:hypothetical protein